MEVNVEFLQRSDPATKKLKCWHNQRQGGPPPPSFLQNGLLKPKPRWLEQKSEPLQRFLTVLELAFNVQRLLWHKSGASTATL